jgi:hypothetical protein
MTSLTRPDVDCESFAHRQRVWIIDLMSIAGYRRYGEWLKRRSVLESRDRCGESLSVHLGSILPDQILEWIYDWRCLGE